MLKTMARYEGHQLAFGTLDCNLLVLEATGFDVSKITPYHDLKTGRKALSSAVGFHRVSSYLKSIGYQKINPAFVGDFDIVIYDRIHCGIYYAGYFFGLNKDNTFVYSRISTQQLQEYEVFKWLIPQ
ncbi:hypothetical protein K6U17_14350 [Vibrio fluvialis]|uniref:hypothetical protein n=1 Tax=Vibrio fluvialis TaxID=676 RepID=UPI001EE9DEF3|nr:hypothetical protein [Vibrio fluvialis]MCG6410399.1 hypothetical protein [Vibrio fluvialis]